MSYTVIHVVKAYNADGLPHFVKCLRLMQTKLLNNLGENFTPKHDDDDDVQ